MPSAAPPGTNWPSVATAAAAEATFDRAQCHARQSHRQTTSPHQSNATAPHRTAMGLLDRGFPTPFFYSVDRGYVALEMELCAERAALARAACSARYSISGATSTLSIPHCTRRISLSALGGFRFWGPHYLRGIVGVLTHFPDRVGRAYPYEVGVASRAGEQKSSLEHQGRCDDRLPPSLVPPSLL